MARHMPDVFCQSRTLTNDAFDLIERDLYDLPEYPSNDPDGWLLGSLEEVVSLFKLSRGSGLVVRFRDLGFPITTAWRWRHRIGVHDRWRASGPGAFDAVRDSFSVRSRQLADS